MGGISATARVVGLTPRAIRKWRDENGLPRSEWTGETNYAEQIEKATQGKVKRAALLQRRSA